VIDRRSRPVPPGRPAARNDGDNEPTSEETTMTRPRWTKPFLIAACLTAVALAPAWAQTPQTLRIGVGNETGSLDPHFRNNPIHLQVADHIFDTLMKQTPDGQMVPGLAASHERIDDKTVRLNLRRGVTWSDGSPFTADDVMFTVERVTAGIPGATIPMDRYFLQGGQKYRKIDDFTIEVTTPEPYPLLLDDFTLAHIISRKHATGVTPPEYATGKGLVGTGPYKFVSFAQGDNLVLEANPTYWGGKPKWDRVVMRPITNPSARVAALLNGSVDVIDSVPTTNLASLSQNRAVAVHSGPSRRAILIGGDHTRLVSPNIKDNAGNPLVPNPLRDWRVRKAIDHAINREAIVARIMDNAAVAAGQIVFPGGVGHVPSIPVTAYDPQRAKALLAQAGYGDGFHMVLHTPPARYGNDVRLSEAVAQMLSAVGIRTSVVTVPEAAYSARQQDGSHSFSLASLGSVNVDPSSLMMSLHTYNPREGLGIANWGRYSNRDLDALVAPLKSVTDQKERERLMVEAAKLIKEDVAVWVLHWTNVIWASRADLVVVPRSDQWTLAESVSRK
jgi:peptide/nickel transport system substrate-binding protein